MEGYQDGWGLDHMLYEKLKELGFFQPGEKKALVGLSTSFPFVEWKPPRRLSRRRSQVLTVV